MRQFLIILTIFNLSLHLCLADKKCRALVLEGGADLGSYQAGSIKAFVENLPKQEVEWDVITGISVGSVMAGGFGQYPKGQEKEASDFLTKTWEEVQRSDIVKDWWPLGKVQGLLFKDSLYDNSPEKKFLESKLTRPIVRNITIGATDANNGELVQFKGLDLSKEDAITAVLASSAVPAFFKTVQFNNTTFIDGGAEALADFVAALNYCRDNGFADEDIIVDSIFCFGYNLTTVDTSNDKVVGILFRTLNIVIDKLLMGDLLNAQNYFPNVNFRYTVIPSVALPTTDDPLSFDHQGMLDNIQIGFNQTKDIINMGEGVNHKKWIKEAERKRKIKNLSPPNTKKVVQ